MRFQFLILIHLLNFSFLFAQYKEIEFRHLDVQISGYSVKSFVQDYKGFMWIGTSNGLNRYGGNRISYFMHDEALNSSISDNGIMALYESKDSSLWIATTHGLNYYNRKKNNFIQYYYKNSDKNSELNSISDISEDSKGNIWLATFGGMCVFNKAKKKIDTFEEHFKFTKNRVSEKFNALYRLKKDVFLAGSVTGDIYEYDIENKTVKKLKFDNGNEAEIDLNYITDICQTRNGKIWVSTNKTGLIRIDKIKDGHVWYKQFLHKANNPNSLTSNNILSLNVFNDKYLLIGTENSYFNILDINTNKFSYFSEDKGIKNGIPQNSFWTIYKDKRNNWWIGTFSKGIYIIDKPLSFKSYYYNRCKPHSIPDFPVTSFVDDDKGNMWIGMDGGGVRYWNRALNEFYPIEQILKYSADRIRSKANLCLYKTSKLDIWAGFYKGGIIIIDHKNRIKQLTMVDGLSSNSISSIVENKQGIIYIGTYGGGVDFYNPKTGKISNLSLWNNAHDLSSADVNVLYVDSHDRLFVAYRNGRKGFDVVSIDSAHQPEIKHYGTKRGSANHLSGNNVFSFAEDSFGNIWIATNDGLNKFTVQTEKFETYKPENNVLSNTIVGIIPDNSGNLWLSTYNGIWSFNIKSEKFRQYTQADGIEKIRFNKRTSFYKNNKGEIFFGANGCFTSFYPDSIKPDTSENRLYITDFLIFNKPVKIDSLGSPLKKQISETKKLTLTYNQSVFTLKYVALNYKASNKINYAYKLENFEKDWNYVGKKRSATYTNLDPGKYFFKLKCTNSAGDWSKNITVLEIEILPPFWRTYWFYLSMLFLLLLSFYIFYTEKTRRIISQNLLLEQKVKKRTLELKELNTRLEEKNEEIFEQKEELHAQSETLSKSNRELKQKTKELLFHQNKLEELVKIRTAELEKSKLKAEESDRLKSAFLANMSHEIRTPLNAVVGFSQLLSIQDLDNETKESYLQQIQSNTDTLLMLIDDILDLSKIESGQISIENSEFNLAELMYEIHADNKVVHKNNKVELRLNNVEKANGIRIKSDRKRMKQILMNLYSNARKFTEEGFIEMGFEREKNLIKIYIKDTGIGISPNELDGIFVRFKRVIHQKGKLFRGAGLGLSIVKKLAYLLGGEIIVESEINKGSVFIFVLSEDIIVDSFES